MLRPGRELANRDGCECRLRPNVVLGLVHPDRFVGGEMRLAEGRSIGRSIEVIRRLGVEFGVSVEEMARGIHDVVNANMASLVREMTVAQGRDPRDFTLVAFGGAGGQHAVAVAPCVWRLRAR